MLTKSSLMSSRDKSTILRWTSAPQENSEALGLEGSNMTQVAFKTNEHVQDRETMTRIRILTTKIFGETILQRASMKKRSLMSLISSLVLIKKADKDEEMMRQEAKT